MMKLTHSTRSSPYRNNRGFTLIEAMVGLVILALGLLSLARFHTGLIESSGLTKARTAAINFGQDKMEALRNLIAKGDFSSDTTFCEGGTPLAKGSVVTDSAAAVTQLSTNTTLSQTWTVASFCGPPRHQITVRVAWNDVKGNNQTIQLSSVLAWLDPASASINTTASTTVPPIIPFPEGSATPGTVPLPSPTSRTPTGIDDTDIVTTSDGTFYLVDNSDFILLTSIVRLVSISGIIGLVDAGATTTTQPADIPLIDVVMSGSSSGYYCFYPVDPANGSLLATSNPVNLASYTCFVPEDWYGNIGIFGSGIESGSVSGSLDDVCLARTRGYKSIHYASDGTTEIGQFGITMPQSGDDFLITSGGATCASITVPAGFTDTNANNSPGPLESTLVIGSTTTVGLIEHTISGTITIDDNPGSPSILPANSVYTNLSIVPSGSPSNGTCTSVVFNPGAPFAIYSCVVEDSWSGTITLNGENASDKTCVSGTAASSISLSTVTSNSTNNNFNIVHNSTVCP